MALLTGGTNANSSLSALKITGAMATADIAAFANKVLDDQINGHPIYPGAFSQAGQIFIPNRGWLKFLPGDYVMVDSTTGWPILLSAYAIASGPWHHS
jgi:hypothetical protein